MSEKAPPLPVATPVEAEVVAAAAVSAAGPAPPFVFGSSSPAAPPPFAFGSASSPGACTEGKAAAEDEEKEEEEQTGATDMIGRYGSVDQQETHIEMISVKLQAAVDAQDFAGAARLQDSIKTCRSHLEKTQKAIEAEEERARDEARRARDEARRARLAARGGNPLPSRSEANAQSRAKFEQTAEATAKPWETQLQQAVLVVGTAVSIAADHGSRYVSLSVRKVPPIDVAQESKADEDPGACMQRLKNSSRGFGCLHLPEQLLQIPVLRKRGELNYPGPPSCCANYAVMSFDPTSVNCFRIGGGWDSTNSRIPIPCVLKEGDKTKLPSPVWDVCAGTCHNGMQLVAEPPAEEFDEADVDAFCKVMRNDFANSLLMFMLKDAGYDNVVESSAPGGVHVLSIELWSKDEGATSISSHLFEEFFESAMPRPEDTLRAHSGDCLFRLKEQDPGVESVYDATMREVLKSSFDHHPSSLASDARALLEGTAYDGYAPAQHLLGVLYQHGLCGVEQDESKATGLFRAAAAQGHEHARLLLNGILNSKFKSVGGVGGGGFSLGTGFSTGPSLSGPGRQTLRDQAPQDKALPVAACSFRRAAEAENAQRQAEEEMRWQAALTTDDRKMIADADPNMTCWEANGGANYFKKITEAGIIGMVNKCPKIQKLCLYPVNVTDFGVIEIANKCPKLREIRLFDHAAVTDAGVIEIANKCPKLAHIQLHGTGVTDASAMEIANKCPELNWIDLTRTKATDAGVIEIANKCPKVTHMSIYMKQLTEGGETRIRQTPAALRTTFVGGYKLNSTDPRAGYMRGLNERDIPVPEPSTPPRTPPTSAAASPAAGAGSQSYVCEFGKYIGKPLTEIPESYIDWCRRQNRPSPVMRRLLDAHRKAHPF